MENAASQGIVNIFLPRCLKMIYIQCFTVEPGHEKDILFTGTCCVIPYNGSANPEEKR